VARNIQHGVNIALYGIARKKISPASAAAAMAGSMQTGGWHGGGMKKQQRRRRRGNGSGGMGGTLIGAKIRRLYQVAARRAVSGSASKSIEHARKGGRLQRIRRGSGRGGAARGA